MLYFFYLLLGISFQLIPLYMSDFFPMNRPILLEIEIHTIFWGAMQQMYYRFYAYSTLYCNPPNMLKRLTDHPPLLTNWARHIYVFNSLYRISMPKNMKKILYYNYTTMILFS